MNWWDHRFSQNTNLKLQGFLTTKQTRIVAKKLPTLNKKSPKKVLPSLFVWQGRNPCNFWFAFLNLTELYKAPKMPSLIWIGSDEKDNYLFSVSSLFFSCSSGLSDFEVTCAWVLKSCVISPTSFLTRSTKKRFYVNITLGNLAIHIRTFFQIRIYLMV